jgi:hypothetical protein
MLTPIPARASRRVDSAVSHNDHQPRRAAPHMPLCVCVCVEDFDTAAHTNVGAPATVGDSSIIAPSGQPGGSRTIVITAAPGTVLHYICTIHPWMQATIIVLP